jgi:PAT family beta-lactamase induction signal transducer AmpG
METPRRLLPTWVMGLGFFPLGASGSVTLISVPQLLAANHVPEQQIAASTAIILMPGFVSFVITPLLDWRFSRRAYAIFFTVIGAIAQFAALAFIHDVGMVTILLSISMTAISMVVSAVGGWFGNLMPTGKKDALGAWFTVANLGAGGVVATIAIYLLRGLPFLLGDLLLALTILGAIPLYLWVECPPADGRLASESFKAFARDVAALLKRPSVLWTILLFVAPCAAFALTNLIGGLGRDFHTPETMVGFIGGVGVSVAGIVGSLLVPPLARKIEPRALYLAIGLVGAGFTLVLIELGRTPATYAVASLGENVFQAAAFSVSYAITLRTIGHDNPLAATQFGLLTAAGSLPLIYMQAIDGHFYGFLGGVNGSFLADAALSAAGCVVLGVLFWGLRRKIPAI